MAKLFTTLFGGIIEEMFKLFKLGKDTDSVMRTALKKTVIGLTLMMVVLTFLAMGQRLISLNHQFKELKSHCEAKTHHSKNQPNASSDSALDVPNLYSFSGPDSHCADNYCRQERRVSMAEGFHGIKIRTIND